MKTTDKQQMQLNIILENANNVLIESYSKYRIITFLKNEISNILIYQNNKVKPYLFRCSKDSGEIQNIVNYYKKKFDDEAKRLANYFEGKKEQAKNITKGSILYSSWGFEQTNINFYIVLERKNTKLIVQEVAQLRTYSRDDSGTCKPNINKLIGEPFERRLTKYACININTVEHASLYNNETLYWSSYA